MIQGLHASMGIKGSTARTHMSTLLSLDVDELGYCVLYESHVQQQFTHCSCLAIQYLYTHMHIMHAL